jgi:hypothetical protein
MRLRISVLAALMSLWCGTSALAQGTTGSMGATGTSPGGSTMPGTAPNGTTPGAISGGVRSLQEPHGGTGVGYNPPAPSLGVAPDATGSTTYNPNLPLPPMPGSSGQATGSATGLGSTPGSSSGS